MKTTNYWRTLAAATITMIMAETVLAATPAERREDLLKVQEMINDPDPLMRIANFEEIVRSKDAFQIEMVIKIAMTSPDASLRSLATRAYLAAFKMIALEVVLPADLSKKWEGTQDDRNSQERLMNTNPTIKTFGLINHNYGGKIRLLFDVDDMSKNQGNVSFTRDGARREKDTTYRILGERISFTADVYFSGFSAPCDFELSGTKDLRIAGKMVCLNSTLGPVNVHALMF